MRTFSVEVRKGSFPINNKAILRIGNIHLALNSGDVKTIKLETEGQYEVEVSAYWVKCKKILVLNRTKSVLSIKSALPNSYFFIWAFVFIPVAILCILGIIKPVFLTVSFFLFYSPLLYLSLIRPSRFYKITVEDIGKPE